ncbi:hypothetical protein [Streptomyces griseorubiginosus]|uniref:hypothetical protein n=1 Tax=Streptomyces griseorubiginosus TaxID=67304 RepID=UPI00340B1310
MSVDVHLGDQEGLDRDRRYLRPVAEYDSDEVHLSVYSWLESFEAWATGMSLCGGSMRQGPLPEGTAVTCSGCLEWRPKCERMLAPDYDPADDDPEALRAKLAVLREQAEASMALLNEFATLADVTHKYRAMGGHDALGENLSCPGCELAGRVRTHLERYR